jgi:neurexin
VEITTTVASTTEEAEEETIQQTQMSTAAPEIATEAPSLSVSSEAPVDADYDDVVNNRPRVDKRIPKIAVTAGKPFTVKIEQNVFYDEEDKTNLKLEFLDKNRQPMPTNSWIRFDPVKREIYGLPLESDVSQYEFKLQATDSGSESVDEKVDVTVQQFKGYRRSNHQIYIQVKLEKNFESPIDWQIRLVRGIVEALDDDNIGSIVVREIRPNKYESNMFTFVFSNESLPQDHCPKDELEALMTRLTKNALNDAMRREITVRNVEKDLIGSCHVERPPITNIVPSNTKNFPPTVRNPVDQVKAYVGQLLVYEVPRDTFYDPEDFTDLKLTLLNEDRTKLEPNHWLQFDAKNREFYGVPTIHDKNQQYILVAEDKNGLTANDALMVEVNHGVFKRDYSASFEYQLDIPIDQFQNAAMKRKFIEGIARVFNEPDTTNILLKFSKKLQYAGRTAVVVHNKTLYRENKECPSAEVEKLREILLRKDRSVRDQVKETIGNDFNVLKITVAPTGNCAGGDTYHHAEEVTTRPDDQETPIISQDLLITYVLPTAIILLMLLIALLIACLLYKRRNTGKMELGDEEERKSFRSKGIPVIFQDELDEKPEIVTKSPVILKDEKPPLLPQYNGTNQDGDDDNMDQYIPPQPLMMGSRESRGKSPVTPSYRKPPPYVSP